jgi:hypothetical protein
MKLDRETWRYLGITYKCQKWLQKKFDSTNVDGYGSKILKWLIL